MDNIGNTFISNSFEKGSGAHKNNDDSSWNLLEEEVSFPIAVINEQSLLNNAKWMQSFSESSQVKLAPHGKTSMAPELFKLQLEYGCWGISLATVPQVVNAYQNGIKRIILANQLIGKYHCKVIADLLSKGDLTFYCFVDSVENANQLDQYFSQRGVTLNILIEMGVEGGRCGWRNFNNISALTNVITQSKCLKLCGLSFYEGVIHGDDAEEKICQFINDIKSLTNELMAINAFSTSDVILTGAGSAWYDVVSKQLMADVNHSNANFQVIIRPGCYLIHDTGIYQSAQMQVLSRSQQACDISGELISSLELWAYVHSVPEAGLAIIGLGKRDVAFDAGLPTPEYVYRPGDKAPKKANSHWNVTHIMDQHCMMNIDPDSDLKPGDIVIFSSSHPCLTMDKWRRIGVMDENYIVNKTIATFF
ncbi:amino acid deaminase [Thalassotalea profundi]|uniref:Amino acid deaminase n=1 Tax=Thalassotalea profundi TaxID=2036687 RepID=A0ABQ3IZB5_9GAMM|nr:amino acid deaminase [Thalassotalea profundi]GHE98991.1 amino acid deaminase [Thalassotalea profundi]